MNYKEEILNALVEVCEKARKEGYVAGQSDGYEFMEKQCKKDYQKGLEDAWKCAKEVTDMSPGMRMRVLGHTNGYDPLSKLTASECMSKLAKQTSSVKIDCDNTDCRDCMNRDYCDYAEKHPENRSNECMDFPKTFDEFVDKYGFYDKEEMYTNNSQLIPVVRVKQWLEYGNNKIKVLDEVISDYGAKVVVLYIEGRLMVGVDYTGEFYYNMLPENWCKTSVHYESINDFILQLKGHH